MIPLKRRLYGIGSYRPCFAFDIVSYGRPSWDKFRETKSATQNNRRLKDNYRFVSAYKTYELQIACKLDLAEDADDM